MTQKQQIILKHINGSSNREISRVMCISKDTVIKYIHEYENKKQELLLVN